MVYAAINEIQKIISQVENLLHEEQGLSCLLCNFAVGPGSKVEAVVFACKPAREIVVLSWHILPYTLHLLMSSPVFHSVAFISVLIRIENANLSGQNPTYTITVY